MLARLQAAVTPQLSAAIAGTASLIASITPSDFAAVCGGFSAIIAGGYAAWKWSCEYRDRKRRNRRN